MPESKQKMKTLSLLRQTAKAALNLPYGFSNTAVEQFTGKVKRLLYQKAVKENLLVGIEATGKVPDCLFAFAKELYANKDEFASMRAELTASSSVPTSEPAEPVVGATASTRAHTAGFDLYLVENAEVHHLLYLFLRVKLGQRIFFIML